MKPTQLAAGALCLAELTKSANNMPDVAALEQARRASLGLGFLGAGAGASLGGAAGALHGALTNQKGKRLKAALIHALLGATAGAGVGASAGLIPAAYPNAGDIKAKLGIG